MQFRHPISLAFITQLLFLIAPVSSSAQKAPSKQEPERIIKNVEWEVVWARGFSVHPDLFIQPRSIVLSGDHVVVLDEGTREITMIDRRTSSLVAGIEATRGSGPGEVRSPSILSPFSGGVAVFDPGNARVSAFNLSGKLLWDTQVSGAIAGLCILDNTSFAAVSSDKRSLETRDTSGALIRSELLPWANSTEPGLAQSVRVAGPLPGGECVVARGFGSQFAVAKPAVRASGGPRSISTRTVNAPATGTKSGTIVAHSYIELMPEPVVKSAATQLGKDSRGSTTQVVSTTSTAPSAGGVTTVGDTVIVRFMGNTEYATFLLDYYHMPDGKYLFSTLLPPGVMALTASAEGVYYATMITETMSGVLAMKPRPSRNPELKPHPLVSPGK